MKIQRCSAGSSEPDGSQSECQVRVPVRSSASTALGIGTTGRLTQTEILVPRRLSDTKGLNQASYAPQAMLRNATQKDSCVGQNRPHRLPCVAWNTGMDDMAIRSMMGTGVKPA